MDRYILLVGGGQYPTVIYPNQTITPSYGMPKMMCLDSDPPHPASYRDPECYYFKNGSRSCPVSVSGVQSSMDHKYQNDIFVYGAGPSQDLAVSLSY